MFNLRYLGFLSMLCFVVSASAQDENRWSLGISFSPDLCYRSLTNSSGDAMFDGIIKSRNNNENQKLGSTSGVNLKYSLNPFFSFETGALYSNKGYASQMPLLFGDQIDSGQQVSLGLANMSTFYQYKYLDIPLKVNYVLTELEKLNLYVTGGLVANVLLQYRTVSYITHPDGSSEIKKYTGGYYSPSNKINVSPFMGIGIQLRPRKRTSIQIEPLYRRQMVSTYNAPIHEYLWNFGVNAVLYYKL